MKPEILCIVGTRPEIIKTAPVILYLQAVSALDVQVLSSGQHRELLRPRIEWFELTIDMDLNVMSHGQSLVKLTGRLMPELERTFKAQGPALVIAQGDTTTVLCTALTCFYLNIPFAHVQAGLGQPLIDICSAVLDICKEFPKLRVLCPVHPNSNVCDVLK